MDQRDEKTEAEKAPEAKAPNVDPASGGAGGAAEPSPTPERGGKGKGGGKGAPARAQASPTPERGGKGGQPQPAPARTEPAKPLRPGLVELVALKTCSAHGMPHFEGDRFSASREVASGLIRKGEAAKV